MRNWYKRLPRWSRIIGILVLSLVLLLLIANVVLSSIAESKVRSLLTDKKDLGYQIGFNHLKINLFSSTIVLKGVSITPDSAFFDSYIRRQTVQKTLYELHIPRLALRHINIISMLNTRLIDIEEIIYEKAALTLYTGGGMQVKHRITADQVEKGINIRRIPIPGIGGVDIGLIRLEDLSLTLYNPVRKDTMLHNEGVDFALEGLDLESNDGDSSTFHLDMRDIRFELAEEQFHLADRSYLLGFKKLAFSAASRMLHLEGVFMKPVRDPYKMAAAFEYRKDVFSFDIEQVDILMGNIREMLITGNYYMPVIRLNGMELSILRNRSLPFDESKRPLLPNQLLKQMKTDLDVDSLFITNGQLRYEESNNDGNPPMKVTLADLAVVMSRITSITDSMSMDNPMRLKLNAKLENSIPMEVNFYFPLLSTRDTFGYYGTLGKGSMSTFNPMLESVAGVNFSSGTLDGITFDIHANDTYAMGTMTMLYHDLVGNVLRRNGTDDNKFLSWIANQVIRSANPLPGSKPRKVPVFFNRSMYKGFGNFAFKPLLSGILASTIPTFDKANQNDIDAVNNTSRKEIRKRNREERRNARQ